MKPAICKITAATLLLTAACSQPAPLSQGEWTLDGDNSSLSFVSVKAGDVGESHVFKTLAGAVSPDGTATLTIDLASVDTGIEVRDQRLRDVLFEVGTFPKADITAQIDPGRIANLDVGASVEQDITATLSLHGVVSEVGTNVRVVRTGADAITVATTRPIILDAKALGLADGVEQLRELAGLPAISHAVPVSFAITYRR